MKVLIGIIFMIVGLIPLIYWTAKEDRKTYFKIMVAASCGAFIFGGLVIIFMA